MGGQLSKCLDCIAPQQQVLDAGQYMNPVIDSDFPDPFVLKYRDHWLAYGTNASGGNVQASPRSLVSVWSLCAVPTCRKQPSRLMISSVQHARGT